MILKYLDYIKESSTTNIRIEYWSGVELKSKWTDIKIEGKNGKYSIIFTWIDPSDNDQETSKVLLDVKGNNEKLLVDEPEKYWNKILDEFQPQYMPQFKSVYLPKKIEEKFNDISKQTDWS